MSDIKETQGLEVVAWVDSAGCLYTQKLLEIMSVTSDGCVPLVRLSDATAVIDQLRAENEVLTLRVMAGERQELAAIKSAPVVMPNQMVDAEGTIPVIVAGQPDEANE